MQNRHVARRGIPLAACWAMLACCVLSRTAAADDDIRQLKRNDWQPRSMLVTYYKNAEWVLYAAIK